MDWDEPTAKPQRTIVVGEDLYAFSVAELEARVIALEVEIARVKAEAATKKARQSAAADLFKR